jgi:nitroreductase
VGRRGEEAHARLFAALAPGNQAWAAAASALVLVVARTAGDDGRAQPWALYDTGQAVAALVTQAQADGLAVHQMGGFDTEAVRTGFGLGEALTPVVVLAIGRQDGAAGLPEHLASREAAPRIRQPLGDLLLPVPAEDRLPAEPQPLAA